MAAAAKDFFDWIFGFLFFIVSFSILLKDTKFLFSTGFNFYILNFVLFFLFAF